jgi:hypothetical protein
MVRTLSAITVAAFLAVTAAPAFADCTADIAALEPAVTKMKDGDNKTKAQIDIKQAKKYAAAKNEKECTVYVNAAKKRSSM